MLYEFTTTIRQTRAAILGRLIVAGCDAATARKMANTRTRAIYNELIPSIRHEFNRNKARTALREALTGAN